MNRHFFNSDVQMANRHMKKMFKIISHQGSTHQNHSEIPPEHQLERQKLTKQETTNVGEDVEKGDPSYTVGGNTNWCSHSGKL